jgi:Protein of unknown function (DUF2934)
MHVSRGDTPKKAAAAPKRARAGKLAPPLPTEAAIPLAVREERIRQVAYGFFEQRGHNNGLELDDWLKAEAMVDQENGGDLQALASAASGH